MDKRDYTAEGYQNLESSEKSHKPDVCAQGTSVDVAFLSLFAVLSWFKSLPALLECLLKVLLHHNCFFTWSEASVPECILSLGPQRSIFSGSGSSLKQKTVLSFAAMSTGEPTNIYQCYSYCFLNRKPEFCYHPMCCCATACSTFTSATAANGTSPTTPATTASEFF